jgi:hypothetical protein
MLHHGGSCLVVQGAWLCIGWVQACCGTLYVHMHFDNGVLGRLVVTAHCVHVRLLELAHMIEVGSVRARESEHVGSITCCNILKQGKTN